MPLYSPLPLCPVPHLPAALFHGRRRDPFSARTTSYAGPTNPILFPFSNRASRSPARTFYRVHRVTPSLPRGPLAYPPRYAPLRSMHASSARASSSCRPFFSPPLALADARYDAFCRVRNQRAATAKKDDGSRVGFKSVALAVLSGGGEQGGRRCVTPKATDGGAYDK